jgi:hypothetical protein
MSSYSSTRTFVLGPLAGPKITGYYAIAERIGSMLQAFPLHAFIAAAIASVRHVRQRSEWQLPAHHDCNAMPLGSMRRRACCWYLARTSSGSPGPLTWKLASPSFDCRRNFSGTRTRSACAFCWSPAVIRIIRKFMWLPVPSVPFRLAGAALFS